MVWRALESDVESHLQSKILRGGDEAAEVLERAELRMDRLVSAFGTADGPWAADVVGRRSQRVVLSLARGPADGVDRWQVDDVEPELAGV